MRAAAAERQTRDRGPGTSPDARDQPVAYAGGVLRVAGEFAMKRAVLQGGAHGDHPHADGGRNQRPAGPQRQRHPREKEWSRGVERMPDDRVGAGIDDRLASVRLDAETEKGDTYIFRASGSRPARPL